MPFYQTTKFKVGALFVGILALIGMMTLSVSDEPGFFSRKRMYYFMLNDASGLVKNSGVRMAGIKIGIIKDIKLEDGRARMELSIDPDIKLTKSARVEIKMSGILGDRFAEIKKGDPNDPPLAPGDEIQTSASQATLDNLIGEVQHLASSLTVTADSLKSAMVTGDRSTPIGRIVNNIENLTQDLADIGKTRKEKIAETIDNIHSISETLDAVINEEGEEGFRSSLKKAMAGLARLDKTMKNIEEISDKINSGKGTIGKLVNDEKTVDELNTAIVSVNGYLNQANRISTAIDFHSEYLGEQAFYKSYLNLKIRPGLDRYYDLGIVDDPKGVVERVDTLETSASGTTNTITKKTYKNKIKFNAQYAKNFYDFTLRGGLIESTGGVGIDYYTLRRKLRFTLDIFDLHDNNAHLRAFSRYDFFKGLYFIGGADDFISKTGTYSTFIGAGFDFTNDDLKTLLQRVNF